MTVKSGSGVDAPGKFVDIGSGVFAQVHSGIYPLDMDFINAGTAGLITNVSRFVTLGTNVDIDTGTQPEDVWSGTVLGVLNGYDHKLIPFMSSATSVEIVSDSANDTAAGSGMRTVVVGYLDATYTAKTVVLTLNGTTPVAFPETVMAINLLTKGTSGTFRGANAGNVSIRDTGGLGKTYSYMTAGKGFAQSSAFTVPAGFTAFIYSILFAINSTDTSARQAEFSVPQLNATGALSRALQVGITDSTPYRHEAQNMPVVVSTEKTTMWITCDAVSANNSSVTGAMVGLFVKNTLLSTTTFG